MEQILNNRPIGVDVENDHDDVITPNHLMTGRRLETCGEVNVSEDNVEEDFRNVKIVRRKRFIDTLLDHFWSRWCKEYLDILRDSQRNDDRRSSSAPNVNDIVIVYDEKMPRQLWRLGRIMKLLISDDGQIRGAEVKIGKANAMIRRPVNKLYPLIVHDGDIVDTKPFTIKKCNENDKTKSQLKDVVDVCKESYNQSNETNDNRGERKRPRRQAAILGDIRRKFEQ